MLRLLAGFTLLLTGADHWTTYLCLRMPVEGWEVIEANPLADWLFQVMGLVPGPAIDTAITLTPETHGCDGFFAARLHRGP